jgi:bifunctional non-homologous end joining protein LigD
LEGVVSKRKRSTYKGERTELWLKSKCRPGQEIVIGGWRQEPGRAFKALLAGVYDQGKLRYAGSVKTGFTGNSDLLPRLRELEAAATPFSIGDPPRKTAEIHWVKPELVANVDIAEWTDGLKLRQASFKGLREDKDPLDVRRETPLD